MSITKVATDATAVMALNHCIQAVDGVPDGHHSHQMGSAARQNEDAEGDEDAFELHIAALPDEGEEEKRNRVVGGGNQAIGDHAQPEHGWVPEVAHPMGHELPRKELLEELEQHLIPLV